MGGAFRLLRSAQPMGSAPGSGAHLEAAGPPPGSGKAVDIPNHTGQLAITTLSAYRDPWRTQRHRYDAMLSAVQAYYSTEVLQYNSTIVHGYYIKPGRGREWARKSPSLNVTNRTQ
jgi:hypothetical protein